MITNVSTRIACALLFLFAPLLAEVGSSYERFTISLDNRILARVEDKTISVLDLMKKMDSFLLHYYPEVLKDPQQHFQFLSSQWEEFLRQMINDRLILADAEVREVKVSESDVRQELQERFGPNVMENLDKINITHDEAYTMIREELLLQNMNWFRVHSKVLQRVGPERLKAAYQEYARQNPPQEEWTYEVLSIGAATKEGEAPIKLGEEAEHLLTTGISSLKEVATILKERADENGLTLTVSEQTTSSQTISPALKQALVALMPGEHTPLVCQKSRRDQQLVHRIYRLKDHIHQETPSFVAMIPDLKNLLLQQEAASETARYTSWLRGRLTSGDPIEEPLPPHFEPFALVMK